MTRSWWSLGMNIDERRINTRGWSPWKSPPFFPAFLLDQIISKRAKKTHTKKHRGKINIALLSFLYGILEFTVNPHSFLIIKHFSAHLAVWMKLYSYYIFIWTIHYWFTICKILVWSWSKLFLLTFSFTHTKSIFKKLYFLLQANIFPQFCGRYIITQASGYEKQSVMSGLSLFTFIIICLYVDVHMYQHSSILLLSRSKVTPLMTQT